MRKKNVLEFDSLEDAPVTYMARVRNTAGTLVTQAALTSIAYTVFKLNLDDPDEDPEETGSGSVTISSTIFDTLQTDSIWDEDEDGYNFKHVIPATEFPAPDSVYRVEYLVTPATGAAFPLTPLEVRTRQFYSS